MTLFSREADETGSATKRFDGVLELPNLRLPLLLAIQAEVERAAYVPDLRDQPLVVGSQGVPPGVPFSRKLRRLLGDVAVQRAKLCTRLRVFGLSGFRGL